MKTISVAQIAKRTGLSRRQIAYLARAGKIPGVIRPNGYHYAYPDTIQLQDWMQDKRIATKLKKQWAGSAPL